MVTCSCEQGNVNAFTHILHKKSIYIANCPHQCIDKHRIQANIHQCHWQCGSRHQGNGRGLYTLDTSLAASCLFLSSARDSSRWVSLLRALHANQAAVLHSPAGHGMGHRTRWSPNKTMWLACSRIDTANSRMEVEDGRAAAQRHPNKVCMDNDQR